MIEKSNQTLGFTDIKLALIRFIGEFLIQTAHFQNNYLDELVDSHTDLKPLDIKPQSLSEFQSGKSSYGSMLLMEFAKVFKALYMDCKSRNQILDSENQKKDITLCLDILFSSC